MRNEELLRETLKETPLPDWVITGIRQTAYEEFHSYGQHEVDGYVLDWISTFESLQKDAEKREAKTRTDAQT